MKSRQSSGDHGCRVAPAARKPENKAGESVSVLHGCQGVKRKSFQRSPSRRRSKTRRPFPILPCQGRRSGPVLSDPVPHPPTPPPCLTTASSPTP
ncbi:unnamed protein product [Lota lota]